MAILQRPYAGQVKNLTPPAAGCGGWFLAVGGVICCGRWRQGWRGCGVSRCWRWAAGCCEVWQGVQAVQLVGCGVIGAALAVLLVSVCFWLAVRVGGVICCCGGVPAGSSTGPGRHWSAPIRQAIRCSGQAAGPAAGRWAKEKGQGGGAWCAAALAFGLHWRFDLLRRVRPGAGGGADLLAVPVGMVSAGTVPAVGVPASRLALAVLHPGRFWTFAGGVRFST